MKAFATPDDESSAAKRSQATKAAPLPRRAMRHCVRPSRRQASAPRSPGQPPRDDHAKRLVCGRNDWAGPSVGDRMYQRLCALPFEGNCRYGQLPCRAYRRSSNARFGQLSQSGIRLHRFAGGAASSPPDARRLPGGPEIWCRLQDSNPRPSVYKTAALPTELSRPDRRQGTSPPRRLPLTEAPSGQRGCRRIRKPGPGPACGSCRCRSARRR